jgi:hypothetical protein
VTFAAATATATGNYSRGTKLTANTALAVPAAAEHRVLNPATDTTLWMQAMNSALFLTADLGPSINA